MYPLWTSIHARRSLASLRLAPLSAGIRPEIDVARARDGAAINEDTLKELFVQQRRKHTCQLFSPQLHKPGMPGLKSDKEAIAWLRLDFSYIPIHKVLFRHGSGAIFAGGAFSR
jgi:hypothetical protein